MPSYVEAILRPGEKIIYPARLSRFLLVLNTLLSLALVSAIGVFAWKLFTLAGEFSGKVPQKPEARENLVLFSALILMLLVVLYFSAKYIYDCSNAEIALTTDRVIGKVPRLLAGFSLQPVDLPLSDIEKVYHVSGGTGGGGSLESWVAVIFYILGSLILTIANYGTVVAVDKEGRKTKFRLVADPNELSKQIRQAARIEEFAPAGTAAAAASGGIAEKALARRPYFWKLVVGWVAALLLAGVFIYAYVYDTEWQARRKPGKAPTSATRTAKTPAPKAAAPDYVQQGLKEKDPQQKIALYTKAIEQNPKNAVAFNNRGFIHYTRKHYDQALPDLDRALALKPDYVLAYNNRGSLHLDRGKYDLALADFNQAIKLKPDYAAAYYNRGLTYFNQKNYDRAIADFSQALGLKPDYAAAYNGRGSAWFRKRDFDQAINDFGRAISLKPNFTAAYANRGNALFEKKDYDGARKDYDRAIALKPDYAWAYYRRAVIWQQRGDAEQARRDYTKAKSLNPKLPELTIK